MARIAGIDLPRQKRIEIALTYIYGIGRTRSGEDLREGRDSTRTRRPDHLSESEVIRLREIIERDYKVEGDLRREVNQNIKMLMDIGCYRGLRHRRGLPVRGQRTHTNARTRKGPKKTVAGKKKPAKKKRTRVASRSRKRPAGETTAEMESMAAKKTTKKKVKKNVQTGVAHIQSTFNNTIITITDVAGNALAWATLVSRASRARASRRPSPRRWPPRSAQARRWSTACARSVST